MTQVPYLKFYLECPAIPSVRIPRTQLYGACIFNSDGDRLGAAGQVNFEMGHKIFNP